MRFFPPGYFGKEKAKYEDSSAFLKEDFRFSILIFRGCIQVNKENYFDR
jgi:hypothetical protein